MDLKHLSRLPKILSQKKIDKVTTYQEKLTRKTNERKFYSRKGELFQGVATFKYEILSIIDTIYL